MAAGSGTANYAAGGVIAVLTGYTWADSCSCLFDQRDLAEIQHPSYPGERLIACRNPLLAEERSRKRNELLAATEKQLHKIGD